MSEKTVREAIARIDHLNEFFRVELLRVETNLVMILLPASLTLLSVSNFTTGSTTILAIRWGLLSFFGAYLVLLFIELLGTESKKQTIKTAQDALYKIAKSRRGEGISAFANENTLFDKADKSLEKRRYSYPSIKLLISMLAATLAILIVILLKS